VTFSFRLSFDPSRHTAETGQDPKGNSSEKIENQSVFDGSPLRGVRGVNRKLTDFQNGTHVDLWAAIHIH
jgi:hypothetical protein